MEIQGFNFVRADGNDDLLTETYRLRYHVCCREAGFLDDSEYPDRVEVDEYDEHSIHFAATDTATGEVVGTVRLIVDSPLGFPLEKHCPNHDRSKVSFPRSQLAEISRLSVSKSLRRRKNDGLYGMDSYHSTPENPIPAQIKQQRKRPVIVFGLYKELYLESKRRGITHWYAAMEEKLNIALRRFLFEFEPIGPVHDYYGPVIPFLAAISNLEKRIYREKPMVAHFMIHGLESRLMPRLAIGFPIRNYLMVKMAKAFGKF